MMMDFEPYSKALRSEIHTKLELGDLKSLVLTGN